MIALAFGLSWLSAPGTPAAEEESASPMPAPTVTRVEAIGEALLASDVSLGEIALRVDSDDRRGRWTVEGLGAVMDIDYAPNLSYDPLGWEQTRTEWRAGAGLRRQQRISDQITGNLSFGGYTGYQDYRTLWIDTFYEQQYGNVRGYTESDPKGLNAGAGLRWEYRERTGTLEGRIGYAFDQVPPAYELGPDPGNLTVVALRERFHTFSARVSSENLVSRRIRLLNEIWLAQTTDREPRVGLQSHVHWAPGEAWVVRAAAGYSHEGPEFDAWNVGAAIEYRLTRRIWLGVSGKAYGDSGEIENSLVQSTAAPGVQTLQLEAMLRIEWARSALRLMAGPYRSDYEALSPGTQVFANLYQDRDWMRAQAAYSIRF